MARISLRSVHCAPFFTISYALKSESEYTYCVDFLILTSMANYSIFWSCVQGIYSGLHDKRTKKSEKSSETFRLSNKRRGLGNKEFSKWNGSSRLRLKSEFLRLFAKILNNVTQKNPNFGFFQNTNASCVCLSFNSIRQKIIQYAKK